MSGLKVLAAMSGGVDSATAAARAVDAGHQVTGVHLALSANPKSYRTGARGCCTLEDARDARRAADVIGIPFYVWDMAERFARNVVDDFVAEYAAGRTPNPCLRCNEKIKFAAVLDRALALGLVNKVVPSAALMDEAIALAERIAANAPLAVRYSKKVMKQAAELPEADGWKLNTEAVGVVFSSADAMEGPTAFAEKRPPKWQGK